MFPRVFAFCVLSLVIVTNALAEDYCRFSPTRIYDGGTATNVVKVVVASVPRPVFPGHGANRPWCIERWRGLGAQDLPTIVERPTLGELSVGLSRVSYKGNRIGHDRFVIEKTWYGPANDLRRAKIVYEVDVVSAPF